MNSAPPVVVTGFTPSKYQQAILDWVVNGTGHAFVNACAGSGKTTTLVQCARLIKGTGTFLAFSKEIAKELKSRLVGTPMKASTIHSLGYGMLTQELGKFELTPNKFRAKVKDYVHHCEDIDPDESKQAIDTLSRMLDLVRLNLVDPNNEDAVWELAMHHSFEMPNALLPAIPLLLKWGEDLALQCIYRRHRRPLSVVHIVPMAYNPVQELGLAGDAVMEEQWMLDRAHLRQLMQDQPDWSNRQYAAAVGRCRKWVQKWKKRLQGTDLNDWTALRSQSRARHTPPEPYHPAVIERILELRDEPPEVVPRKLGAPTILYYLHEDQQLKAGGYRLPRSTSTIWKILDTHQRILRPVKIEKQPFERPAPMDTWEIDFTDVSTAQGQRHDKHQHQVEAFAVVDRGTSILVDLQASDDYHAQTAVLAMASTLLVNGLPRCIVFDRDPRFVGRSTVDRYPSAFIRFLLCLGIELDICPPHRPDLKPFVERYFRTLNEECVQIKQPATLIQTQDLFEDHRYTYNQERPNQARSCGNRPPYVVFPQLPRLPRMPDTVDPDHWLQRYHGQLIKRRVDHGGRIQIDKHRYYIQRALAGRYVVCQLDATQRAFHVVVGHKIIKTIPIKGLYGQVLALDDYFELILKEAESEQRRLAHKRLRRFA